MPNWIACWPKAFLRAKLPEKIRLICNKFFLYERLASPRPTMHGVPALAGCVSGQAQYPNTSVALPAKARLKPGLRAEMLAEEESGAVEVWVAWATRPPVGDPPTGMARTFADSEPGI